MIFLYDSLPGLLDNDQIRNKRRKYLEYFPEVINGYANIFQES